MVKYKAYQHVERLNPHMSGFSAQLVSQGCYYQPKIDGTNTAVGMGENGIWVGKRKNVMGEGDDNRGVKSYVMVDHKDKFEKFFADHPGCILYGEWLVPHTIRTYAPEAWNKLYIFDVVEAEDSEEATHIKRYVPYSEYRYWLEECGIEYVPATFYLPDPAKSVTEQIKVLQDIAQHQTYLMQDGAYGEGIVVKNYAVNPKVPSADFIQWGKIVSDEFKLGHQGKAEHDVTNLESRLVSEFLDTIAVTKEYEKILEGYATEEEAMADKKSLIPRTLETVWYAFLEDNLKIILKKYKNPTINFRALRGEVMDNARIVLGW